MNSRTAFSAFGALILTSITSASVRAQTYAVTDLGSLPAYNRYFGNGINLSGQAAVSSAITNTPGHALLYNGARLIDLGVFKNAGANQSAARAINNLGWVVGPATSGKNMVAALWRNGQIVQVAPNFAADSFGINNAASPQITGSYHPRPGQGSAFLWQNGVLTNLPFGEGHAINDLAQIAGRNNDSGCFWSQSTGLKILPDLGFGGVTSADGINNSGVCIGFSHDSTGRYHAVYWDAANAIHDMGLFSHIVRINGQDTIVFEETKAYAINGGGTIVGQFYGSPGGAFRWDAGSGYVDLNSLIDHTVYPGWVLTSATGINDHGQIVSTGNVSGDPNEHAFILTPQ